jgi:bacterial/archaeal transporter family-2 protein
MIKILLVLLTFLSGIGLSSQAAINGGLGKVTGAIEAAFISSFIAIFGLFLAMLCFGKGSIAMAFTVPKWQLLGGLFGAIYVTVIAYAVPKVGAGISLISVIFGQMVMSLLIDNFGWFHSKQIPINTPRLIGILLLVAALILIYQGTPVENKAQKNERISAVSAGEVEHTGK